MANCTPFLLIFLSGILLRNVKSCMTSQVRNVPKSQYSPPPPPPAKPSTCGHSIHYNSGQIFGAGIIGGLDAKPNEFPWQVRLRIISGSNNFLCGGALINNRWVITAAHCARAAIGNGAIVAVLGDHDRSKEDAGEVAVGITKAIVHPNYNVSAANSNDYDIAMLQLQRNVTYTGAIQPICLPTSCATSACQGGATAWITGWGTQEEASTSGTDILQRAWVPIVSQQKCQAAYSYVMTQITDRMLCGGFDDGGVDTCRGDSGGPLICNYNGYWELGGVTSFGQGCGTAGYYGVYTKVCVLIDWIRTQASQLN